MTQKKHVQFFKKWLIHQQQLPTPDDENDKEIKMFLEGKCPPTLEHQDETIDILALGRRGQLTRTAQGHAVQEKENKDET